MTTWKSVIDNYNDSSSTPNDVDGAEKLWAKELYELSAKERDTINDELHGASVRTEHGVLEEQWSVKEFYEYLERFQQEIDTRIRPDDKRSYTKGLEMRSSYILNPQFRMGFLRAERYDVEKAAVRFCKCLEFLAEVFGNDALLRPLMLSDLTRKEMKFLREGFVQILPSRDRLGRRIVVMLGSYGGTRYSVLEKFRVCALLIFSILAEDATTQRLGMVSIASFTKGAEQWMKEGVRTIASRMKDFFNAVPLRWSANHLCIPDNPIFRVLRTLMLFVNGIEGRKILRVHVGTPMECDYKLRSFGIPTEDIPRTSTHSIKLKNHTRLLKVRKSVDSFREQAMETNGSKNFSSTHIECPEINCVLFGRNAWDHPGNVEFREVIQKLTTVKENYHRNETVATEMYCLNKKIIQESMSRNFQFLVYDRQTLVYKEATEYEEIWKLVAQSLREHRKRSKAKRMIDEMKATTAKNNNRNLAEDVSNLNSVTGEHSDKGAKFMKDCDGCNCLVTD